MKRTILLMTMVIFATAAVAAQTNNRRPKPRPLATPIPADAAVIGPGGSFPSEVIIEPIVRETPAPPTERPTNGTSAPRPNSPSSTNPYDERQKRLLLNLDILTRAEQRSESLRKQYFEMVEKENTANTRLSQIEVDIRPEVIERSVQMVGSLRPEELRDSRRRSLESERRNVQAMLAEIQSAKNGLAVSLQRSDQLVERLRARLEKEIEDSFLSDDED